MKFLRKILENLHPKTLGKTYKNTTLSYPAHASTVLSVLRLHILSLVPYFATRSAPFLESVNIAMLYLTKHIKPGFSHSFRALSFNLHKHSHVSIFMRMNRSHMCTNIHMFALLMRMNHYPFWFMPKKSLREWVLQMTSRIYNNWRTRHSPRHSTLHSHKCVNLA